MSQNLIINIPPLFVFGLFIVISFLNINRKSKFKKILFLISLTFSLFSYLLYLYTLIETNQNNFLTLITYSSFCVILLIYLLCCLIDFSFIRLRLVFVPYFFLFLLLCNYLYIKNDEFLLQSNFFENRLLTIHVIMSLLSYSFLTNSALSSIIVYAQEKNIKNSNNRKNFFSNLLPSIYESELLTIKLLCLAQTFLLFSLISGFYYSSELSLTSYIFNEKSILSIFTFFLICFLLFVRFFFGLSGRRVFNFALLSYVFINLSYFGYKLF